MLRFVSISQSLLALLLLLFFARGFLTKPVTVEAIDAAVRGLD